MADMLSRFSFRAFQHQSLESCIKPGSTCQTKQMTLMSLTLCHLNGQTDAELHSVFSSKVTQSSGLGCVGPKDSFAVGTSFHQGTITHVAVLFEIQ